MEEGKSKNICTLGHSRLNNCHRTWALSSEFQKCHVRKSLVLKLLLQRAVRVPQSWVRLQLFGAHGASAGDSESANKPPINQLQHHKAKIGSTELRSEEDRFSAFFFFQIDCSFKDLYSSAGFIIMCYSGFNLIVQNPRWVCVCVCVCEGCIKVPWSFLSWQLLSSTSYRPWETDATCLKTMINKLLTPAQPCWINKMSVRATRREFRCFSGTRRVFIWCVGLMWLVPQHVEWFASERKKKKNPVKARKDTQSAPR